MQHLETRRGRKAKGRRRGNHTGWKEQRDGRQGKGEQRRSSMKEGKLPTTEEAQEQENNMKRNQERLKRQIMEIILNKSEEGWKERKKTGLDIN